MVPIISLVPHACSHLLNNPLCIFEPHTKEILVSLSTKKSQTLQNRRRKFSLGVWNRVPPSSKSYDEGLDVELEKSRPPKSYNTSLWGDYFHSFTSDENEKILRNEHQILKEDVRRELLSSRDKPLNHLKLIDVIKRLGVAYHFKDEIEESLAEIYQNYNTYGDDGQYDLYHTSLKFRVLRQHGFYISCDSFQKFTDENGTFSESLATDISGILSLFEASHVRIYREEILEEALSFTTRHLTDIKMQVDNPFFEEVKHALSRPLQRSLVRLEAKHHIMMYQHDPLHIEVLLKFAKVDFNILQSLHKRELQEMTRWWEGLCYAENFPYARDRLVENYFFAMIMVPEPKYSLSRITFAKVAVWNTILDDLYDSHGTNDELRVLTDAIERWDKSCIHRLPNYLKVMYEMMLDDFEQFGEDMIEAGNLNYLGYLIVEDAVAESWHIISQGLSLVSLESGVSLVTTFLSCRTRAKDIARSYMKAFKCRHAKKINAAKFEEYIRHGMIAIGPKLLIGSVMATMGAEVTEGDLECLSSLPNVIRSPGLIARLLNDIVGYETDTIEGNVSSVFCYMEQYGVSKEQAFADIRQRVEAEWVEMNEEMCLYPRTRQRRLLWTLALPMAQIPNAIYDGEDGFRMVKSIMKDYISRTLVDPITC